MAIIPIHRSARSISPFPQDVAVWDDVLCDISQASGISALTLEAYRDTSHQMYFMRHDQADAISMRFQMPHRWRRDTQVRVHLHYIPMVNPVSTQVVSLIGRYAWAHAGAALPAWASWTTFATTIDVGTSDAFEEGIKSLFSTTPTGSLESSVLCVYLQREGAAAPGGNDTYETPKSGGTVQANLAILYLDAHFQVEKLGTLSEIPA